MYVGLAEENVVVGVAAEVGARVVVVGVAVGGGTRLLEYGRIVDGPVARAARLGSIVRAAAAVLVGVELGAGAEAGDHLALGVLLL